MEIVIYYASYFTNKRITRYCRLVPLAILAQFPVLQWKKYLAFRHVDNENCSLFYFLQVAHALDCYTTSDDELSSCLRNRTVERLLHAKIDIPKYVPAYVPLIDTTVIPEKPVNLMENTQLFGRYDLSSKVSAATK